MIEFTFWDIVRNLLLAARWTVLLSLVAFVGGGVVGMAVLFFRIAENKWARRIASGYIALFQGTPLLMQLFLMFFGLPMLGFRIEPWTAAVLGLTFFASAYLAEIWRSGVDALPRGQWDAGASLGLHYLQELRLIILPQAFSITRAPTVGFLVQLIKSDGADLDHRFRGAGQDLQRDQQCDLRAIHGLRPGRADLLRHMLSADAVCTFARTSSGGPLMRPAAKP